MQPGLVIVVSPGFRVYRGLTGLIDWRSHGGLSRFLKQGFYHGADSEWLLLGQPVGEVVGTVLCVGCDRNSALSSRSTAQALKQWHQQNTPTWKKLKLSPLRWGLSEDWMAEVDLWRSVFHNEEYVDVSRLQTLEEQGFHARKEHPANPT